jgi:hypothetical protein
MLDDLREKPLFANEGYNASKCDIATAAHKLRREDRNYGHEVCISVPKIHSQDKFRSKSIGIQTSQSCLPVHPSVSY